MTEANGDRIVHRNQEVRRKERGVKRNLENSTWHLQKNINGGEGQVAITPSHLPGGRWAPQVRELRTMKKPIESVELHPRISASKETTGIREQDNLAIHCKLLCY